MPTKPTLAATPEAPLEAAPPAEGLPEAADEECVTEPEVLAPPDGADAPEAAGVGAGEPELAPPAGADAAGEAPAAGVLAAPPTGAEEAASTWAWTVELRVPDMPESLHDKKVEL